MRKSSESCAVNVFEAATLTSVPARVKSTESASRVICEPIMFVIATVCAPIARASLTASIVSRVSPGLRDPDHQRVCVQHRVPVDPLGRDVVLDRDTRPLLDRVPSGDGRVVRRARGEDHDPPQVAQLVVVHPEPLELEPTVPHAIADGVGDGLRLLVDLLEHERLEAGLLGPLVVPVELDDLVLDGGAVRGGEVPRARRGDLDDLAVVRELHDVRVAQERGGVRRDEGLALAQADHHRALVPRSDEPTRMVAMDRDEREVAFELRVRRPHRGDEIAFVGSLDQMGDRLGVGLRGERVPFRDQALAQLAVVLDDPVEDDRERGGVLGGERVSVALRDAAVGRPAGVAQPGRRR